MSENSAKDCEIISVSPDNSESPRKRMRLDNSAKKSWSLMDRRADQEVLQEMGVCPLDPDENETLQTSEAVAANNLHHKPSLKRKQNIENVNPNVNMASPPRAKHSPKVPRSKCSPSPGPSRGKSPRSADKCNLQPCDPHVLETTIIYNYQIDEETPLAQSVSAEYLPSETGFDARSVSSSGGSKKSFTSLGKEDELLIRRRTQYTATGEDSFRVLSDEVMLSVFRWLPKRSLAHCMRVCKRWNRVACDETLWQRLDLANRVLAKNAIGRILDRKPVIVRLACSEIGEWHPTTPPVPSRIQYLDLGMCTVDGATLDSLLERCPQLRKLSLEDATLRDASCEFIGRCRDLETLNLTLTKGITADGLRALLKGCTNLVSLNISWCNLSEAALEVLVCTLPARITRLNVSGARVMNDEMVAKLVKSCPRLVELDLSDCSKLGIPSVQSILSLTRLEHLALSRCYLLPPHALTKLGSMPSLQYLDVWGMLQTASLFALRAALPSIQINQFMFSAIARPTVGNRRTSIWGLRTRE